MFEVYKNRNILQFAQILVSQLPLEDDGLNRFTSPVTLVAFFFTTLGHTNMIILMCNWEINEFAY